MVPQSRMQTVTMLGADGLCLLEENVLEFVKPFLLLLLV